MNTQPFSITRGQGKTQTIRVELDGAPLNLATASAAQLTITPSALSPAVLLTKTLGAGVAAGAAGYATITLTAADTAAIDSIGSGVWSLLATINGTAVIVARGTVAITGPAQQFVDEGVDQTARDLASSATSAVLAHNGDAMSHHILWSASQDHGPYLQAAIDDAGTGAKLQLEANRIWVTKVPITLRDFQKLDLNGSTIQRAAEFSTTATEAVQQGTNTVTVTDASGFAIGQFISFGDSSNYATSSYKISGIADSTITTDANFSKGFSSGVKVTRVVVGIVTSYDSNSYTHASDIAVVNGTIDGNRANNTTLSAWYHGQDVVLWGPRGTARDLHVINSPSEGIFGGNADLYISRCRFSNIGGNGVHVSAWQNAIIENCRFENTNQLAPTWVTHNDGAVTLSDMSNAANYGRISVRGCWFDGVRCAVGGVLASTSSYVTVTDNWILATTNGPMYIVTADGSPHDVIFSRNQCYGSGLFDLHLTSGSSTGKIGSVLIDANIFTDTRIAFGRGCDGVTLSNNEFTQTTACSSVTVNAPASGVSILNNRFRHTATTGANNTAIYISGAMARCLVAGNTVAVADGPTGSNGVLILSGYTHTNFDIVGNSITMAGARPALVLGKGVVAKANTLSCVSGTAVYCESGGSAANATQVFCENTVRGSGTSVRIYGGSYGVVARRNTLFAAVNNGSGGEATVVVSDNDVIV